MWKNYLTGIQSFNAGCTKPGYPGVSVRITAAPIYEWIRKVVS